MEQNGKLRRTGNIRGRKKGGLISMPFIFANDVCEKLAVVGFTTNFMSYLTKQLHMPMTKAANTQTNFSGNSSLTPLLGAFICDSYAGKFATVTVASIIYLIGLICLTASATFPQLRPPPCKGGEVCQEATSGQLALVYVALWLGALGAGGIRPCVVAFGADQFDESEQSKRWSYFNWYYFIMGGFTFLAVTLLVYVQDNVGWGWGLGIPTIAMFLSIITFVVGYPLYRNLNLSGSPFIRLIKVIVAIYHKRNITNVPHSKFLYQNDELDDPISQSGKLLHSEQLTFLDKAAIVTDEDDVETPNLWRLSTVHRVEELKALVSMAPIWASGILLITAYTQQNTFSLQQAATMDRHLTKSFQIPAGSMTLFTTAAMLIMTALYDRVLVRVFRRFTGLDRGISFLHRMGIGLFIAIFATFVAGFIEMKRKKVAMEHGLLDHPNETIPISVFWLVPQYGLHGIAEAFMSIGHMEFFYDQAPESMTSTAMALFWASISLGNYISTFLVTMIHKYSAKPDGSNWLPDNNLNVGKLEYLYWIITVLQIFNLIYYLYCAKIYTYKKIQAQDKESCASNPDIELATTV